MSKTRSDELQIVIDALPQMFFHKDTENNILRANKAAADAVGTTVACLVGTHTTQWFPDEAGNYYKDDKKVMASGVPHLKIIEQFQVEGEEKHWISTDKYPHFDDSGNVDGILVFIHDVTAESNAEEDRQELEAQIRHAQKLEGIGVLAMGVAHDFNNHLMSIVGNTELALTLIDEHNDGREYLENAMKSAQQASEVCSQLLTYAGKKKFDLNPCSLSDLILEINDLLTLSISKKIKLILKLAQPLPAISADAGQIKQILMNLVTNASESLGEDSGEIHIVTGIRHYDEYELSRSFSGGTLVPGSYCYVQVRDNGPGMSDEVLAQIFQPFYTTKTSGRGLGLATVLGTLRSHNGAIKVSSESSVGTTVELVFPINSKKIQPQKTDTPSASIPRQETTVLVVDDDDEVRFILQSMLERAGYAVITATDGLAAIEIFDEFFENIDAVLLDFSMPVLNGAEVFTKMNERKPGIPILFSSGNPGQIVIDDQVSENQIAFIKKPYRSSDLLEKLGSLLKTH